MPFGRQNPFKEIERMLERMGRDLEGDRWPVDAGPDLDLADHGDRYVVAVDLPGFEKDEVDVRLVGGDLHLDADRELETEAADVDYLRKERRRDSVSRRVSLPDPVEEEAITARLADGVLTVELPKANVDGGTSIDID